MDTKLKTWNEANQARKIRAVEAVLSLLQRMVFMEPPRYIIHVLSLIRNTKFYNK